MNFANHLAYMLTFAVILMLTACQFSQHAKAQPKPSSNSKLVFITSSDLVEPEFSGCMPADQEGRFWIASDENKKVIWQFNSSGDFESEFSWDGKRLNDLEGLAADGNGGFFAITSQSLNSDKDSKKSRNRLTHFKDFSFDEGDRRTVSRFRDTLIANFNWTQEALRKKSKKGGIDIEGLAYDPLNDRMWFGFRGPLVKGNSATPAIDHALLIQLDRALIDWDPEDRTPPLQFSWAADGPLKLDLGGHGIRDLYYLGKDRLLILSGLTDSNPAGSQPPCKLWTLNTQTGDLNLIREIPQVPSRAGDSSSWSAAEGICLIKSNGAEKLLVVYDSKHSGIFQIMDLPAR